MFYVEMDNNFIMQISCCQEEPNDDTEAGSDQGSGQWTGSAVAAATGGSPEEDAGSLSAR